MHAEDVEVVRRYARRAELEGATPAREWERLWAAVIHAGNSSKGSAVPSDRRDVGVWHVDVRSPAIERMHDDEPVLGKYREPVDEHHFVDGEHRRRRPDAEGEDRDGADGEGRSASQAP